MAWALRLIGIVAAAITSLFVAREAMNFGFVETLVTVVLVVGLILAAVGWTMRHEA
ncbi:MULTISPECIES: hypothetical protein [unclassified Tardiphaga]|uniref:hypothetical protein n=1 Tax=unclassified Tardiphaga TaxID=2631404 RepID=UPI00143D7AF2|nr:MULTISPECIES: hypothetical protein [unclassified Tardiphaga]